MNKERAQKIRNVVVSHVQQNHAKKIKPNITQHQGQLLTNFTNIPEIVRIPADKGTAIVCENEKKYIQKEDELLRDMDVERSNKTEKQLIQRAQKTN